MKKMNQTNYIWNFTPHQALCSKCRGNFYYNTNYNQGTKNCSECQGTNRTPIPMKEFYYDKSETITVVL